MTCFRVAQPDNALPIMSIAKTQFFIANSNRFQPAYYGLNNDLFYSHFYYAKQEWSMTCSDWKRKWKGNGNLFDLLPPHVDINPPILRLIKALTGNTHHA